MARTKKKTTESQSITENLPERDSYSYSYSSFPLRFKISPCFKQTVLKRRGTEEQSNEEIRKELKISDTSAHRLSV